MNQIRFEVIMKGEFDYRVYDNHLMCYITVHDLATGKPEIAKYTTAEDALDCVLRLKSEN
jgi:hypothetical protein